MTEVVAHSALLKDAHRAPEAWASDDQPRGTSGSIMTVPTTIE